MRTLRLSLTGTVILALLAGTSGAVVAQDDPADQAGPVLVNGTMELGPYTDFGTQTCDAAGVCRIVGQQGSFTYEASDPRLDGEVTFTTNVLSYEPPSGEIFVNFSTRVLGNDRGRWVGTDTWLVLADGTDETIHVVWRGEDAYEGLTAIIVEDWEGAPDDPDRDPYSFVGTIVAGMPDYPEPPAE